MGSKLSLQHLVCLPGHGVLLPGPLEIQHVQGTMQTHIKLHSYLTDVCAYQVFIADVGASRDLLWRLLRPLLPSWLHRTRSGSKVRDCFAILFPPKRIDSLCLPLSPSFLLPLFSPLLCSLCRSFSAGNPPSPELLSIRWTRKHPETILIYIAPRSSTSNRPIKGRLLVCSNSILFDPQDQTEPILKFSYRKCETIRRWDAPLMSAITGERKWLRPICRVLPLCMAYITTHAWLRIRRMLCTTISLGPPASALMLLISIWRIGTWRFRASKAKHCRSKRKSTFKWSSYFRLSTHRCYLEAPPLLPFDRLHKSLHDTILIFSAHLWTTERRKRWVIVWLDWS